MLQREAMRAATHYYTGAWPNIKTQEKNVILSLLYTYDRLNCLVLAFSKKRKASSPKGNAPSPEPNVPRSNLISKNI